ncbi:DUF1003 domain-containing protein [Bradyrhizobium liaoningense]|uniref:DUF1003 domain-containing protein n=1 Tax=Bradyrhizobium liaoningense TaxID=43992 RepID=UPI001BACAE49|nr:DUF1003 domain-containing protein [Bradyrhizobium liaoningense]MBR0719830.1 DUF1003 domain-containing protein [Bradyrhizobium liaoningense]
MAESTPSGQRSGAAARNIEAILRIEKQDERELQIHHRALHAVGRFVGIPFFFALQSLGVGLWLWINTCAALSWRFDEYPFPLLSVVLALEAVLLTSCVLIRQNISDQAFERRNHLELQINLPAERESTMSLALLQRIAAHLKCPVEKDAQSEQLADETEVDQIAQDLREREEKDEAMG